jgi:hypothetical protein
MKGSLEIEAISSNHVQQKNIYKVHFHHQLILAEKITFFSAKKL